MRITAKTLRTLVRRGRRSELTWRYLFNLRPTVSYLLSRSTLQAEAARVVALLNRDGVAMTSVQALFGHESCYGELCDRVEKLRRSMAGEISEAQVGADVQSAIGKKKFIIEYLGRYPQFDPASVFARFALERNILGVANAYLGMHTRLRHYNVWHTFPTRSEPRESQLWHRDREDYLILKVFLYLADVDEGAGPFTYARGSHPKGMLRSEAAYSLEGHVRRSTDAQMAEVIPSERWFRGIGPKGTIIFADTRGYHRGGLARERPRVMFTAMFTSQTSQSEEFMVSGSTLSPPLDKEQAFAIAGRRR